MGSGTLSFLIARCFGGGPRAGRLAAVLIATAPDVDHAVQAVLGCDDIDALERSIEAPVAGEV